MAVLNQGRYSTQFALHSSGGVPIPPPPNLGPPNPPPPPPAPPSNNGRATNHLPVLSPSPRADSHVPRSLLWPALVAFCIIVRICVATSFSSISVMISFSVPRHLRGRVNGLAQTAAAAIRVVAPVTVGVLYGWCTQNGLPWPLDYHLPFHIIGGLGLAAAALSFRLPASIEKPAE